MDELRAGELLALLAKRLGDGVLLWRGTSLSGSDVDVVVREGSWEDTISFLEGAGLVERGDHSFSTGDGSIVIDLVRERDWPFVYPPLAELAARAVRETPDLPPVASPGDRLLIFAAEAVAGRPLAKLVPKLRELARGGTAFEQARAIGHDRSLARLAADPDAIERSARGEALGYRSAIAYGIRSPRGRRALRGRVSAALRRRIAQTKR